ncbi:exported protein of unknown function [Nitrosotalea devaniterrae]|uniref:Uncharacterized protein n=1 Tax=Nitrosotalea devaniterrae TaxID=1078905 RepID=A0A128A217_9ARCH|nr:exported protein of unknown function [Candidatus Nitrosotalea devanaterra]
MKILFILIILIPAIIMSLSLYPIAVQYANYLYWLPRNVGICNCKPDTNCFCPAMSNNTASMCVYKYRNSDPSFNPMCTITRWDYPYWTIQVTAILLSLIPIFASLGILSFLYYGKKK